MRRIRQGWVCRTHAPDSEEWRVLLALGAKLSCQMPKNKSRQMKISRRRGSDRTNVIVTIVG